MKQRVMFVRTESIEVEFEVPVDPLTRANAEALINSAKTGNIGDRNEVILSREMGEWTAKKSDPGFCQCVSAEPRQGKVKAKPAAKPRRK